MDPAALAAIAVATLSPWLAKAGEGAAKKLGENAVSTGGALFGWMRDKLSGRARNALDALEAEPEDADNRADLQTRLTTTLTSDPALVQELLALLPAQAHDASTMTQDVSGAGAKAVQIKGSRNSVSLG